MAEMMNGQGTTLKIVPASGTAVTIGKLTRIGEITPVSEIIDVTTLDSPSGYRQYMPGYRDAGELTLAGFFLPGDGGQKKLMALYAGRETENFEIVFPDQTKASFSAFIQSYSIGAAEVNGALRFSATLRLSGAVTVE